MDVDPINLIDDHVHAGAQVHKGVYHGAVFWFGWLLSGAHHPNRETRPVLRRLI